MTSVRKDTIRSFLDQARSEMHLEEAYLKSRIIVELEKILKTKKIRLPQLYASDLELT